MPADFDHVKLKFGKYKGKTPEEIAESDPSYIVWMYETLEEKNCSEALYRDCKKEVEKEKQKRSFSHEEAEDEESNTSYGYMGRR